jgi:hypothetical protein
MAASTTLDVLIAVDHQLARVSRERDRLTGRRNQLLAESQSTLVFIGLSEHTEYIRPAEAGFGRRVADSFLGSWNGLLRNGGNFMVFIARVSIPLAIWAVIAGITVIIAVFGARRIKRSGKKPEAVAPQEGETVNE